jgi:Arc/MetJ-type ribon-helix-helix transcriptional regulator
MSKNEIHARLPPELMEALKRICSDKNSNLSDVVRAALVLYVDAYEYALIFLNTTSF